MQRQAAALLLLVLACGCVNDTADKETSRQQTLTEDIPVVHSNQTDASLCQGIDKPYRREECLYQLAQDLKNASLCGRMRNKVKKDKCYLNVGVSSNNPSACEQIADYLNKNMEDNCYMRIAAQLKEPKICDKIQNPQLKTQCDAKAMN